MIELLSHKGEYIYRGLDPEQLLARIEQAPVATSAATRRRS